MIKKILILLILSAVLIPVFSQNSAYSIVEIIYNIDGQTTPEALVRYMDLKSGDSFAGYEEMELLVKEEIQKLLNLRLFQEGSFVLENISESEYSLTLNLRDGWKIYPIPYPKFDSNKGFRLGMEFYYFNMGGSLLNFLVKGAVDFKLVNGKITTGDWKINPSINNIKIGNFIFSAEIFQSFTNNRTVEKFVLQSEYDVYHTDLILSSKIAIPGTKHHYYTLSPEFQFTYGFKDYLGTAQYIPFRFNWNHSFTYEHLDWIGFQRSGYSTELVHSLGFSSIEDTERISTSISGEALCFILWKKINPSVRFYMMKSWNEEIVNLGENMRGLLDAYMYGEQALFLNLGIQFPIVDIRDKFELHLQPFVDMGTVFKKDFRFSGGADLIIFADRFSSMQFRFSFGTDIKSLFTSDPDMYEIEISSSLAY